MLKIKELKEIFQYDATNGDFIWKIKPCRKVKIGSGAGSFHKPTGYVIITYNGYKIKAHRLAWAFIYNEWPEFDIDHINNIRHDNRQINLREATRQQNAFNRSLGKTNKSGIKGVYFIPKSNKWAGTVWFNYKRHYLGSFSTPEDAENAVISKRKELHGKFSNNG